MTQYPEANLLANALSPYLRQHAGNPVHWREWGEAALAEAQETDRPILLSIGYAACHWCHVMAHESFEDPEIAGLMNRHFVNVKLDREERPDIDQLYMSALHVMGEQGGWPLTMFLTPDGRPFWGGTYFPARSRHGRPGFRDVLHAIHQLYTQDKARISSNAQAISTQLQRSLAAPNAASQPELADLDSVSQRLLSATDPENGGLGSAPKFPSSSMWEALWRGSVRTRNHRMRDAAIAWVRALCKGGIYDHLGGGIHRYTVDGRWLIPHFEKMLYDNAQFIRALCTCFAATSDTLFKERVEETIAFLLNEMRCDQGAFHSSFDADSEGHEGRFYVWSRGEITSALGPRAALFEAVYDITETGNWEGKNILNRLANHPALSAEDREAIAECRRELKAIRNRRTAPARDDKVLTDWNGLTVRALAEAGKVFDRPDWVNAAAEAYDFVTESIVQRGRLAHAWRNGAVAGPALATDYAAMINAAVSLHLATGKADYLSNAEEWAEQLESRHSDGSGGYYLAPVDRSDLLVRARSEQDEAIPSATAMAIEGLARLAQLARSPALMQRAETALRAAWGRIRDNPYVAVGIVNAADTVLRSPKLVITGAIADELQAVAFRHPDPARLDLHLTDPKAVSSHIGLSGLADLRAAAYLCRGPVCLPPISDAGELDRQLSQPAAT